MRYLSIVVVITLALVACKKDKFTTAPQIKYKSIKPDVVTGGGIIGAGSTPVLTFEVTDAEGDLSFVDGQDSAWIYVKNLLANTRDSFKFPDLTGVTTKNFKFDVDVTLSNNVLKGGPRPRPKTDTLYFEVYVTDIAKNKSNVIVTGDPVYFVVP